VLPPLLRRPFLLLRRHRLLLQHRLLLRLLRLLRHRLRWKLPQPRLPRRRRKRS
jgi:hypothetical protein